MPAEQTERVTLRLPVSELSALDTFVASGEYSNRSEVIRRAIREFVRANANKVFESHQQKMELESLKAQLEAQRLQVEAQVRETREAIGRLSKR